jgi:hypothetical protein
MDEKTEKKEFLVLMAMLCEVLPPRESLSKERGKIYWDFLKKYPIKLVAYAVKQSIRELDFFPSIHQLINFIGPYSDFEYIKQIEDKQPEDGKEKVRQLISNIGKTF